jgi:protein-S-isoprenylcysteine O-methyltransferase Ste14
MVTAVQSQPFFRQDDAAGVLVIATIMGAVAAEWYVTLRERRATERRGLLGQAAGVLHEVTLLRTGERREEDARTKWVLIGGLLCGFFAAIIAQRALPGAAMPSTGWPPTLLAVALIWLGTGLRCWAIWTLGSFFRRDIQVATGQTVVRSGPYAAIRHPAYAGNLLMAAGLGLLLANWISLAAIVALTFAGLLPRIRAEDALLSERLGEPYRRYAATTARIMPGVW